MNPGLLCEKQELLPLCYAAPRIPLSFTISADVKGGFLNVRAKVIHAFKGNENRRSGASMESLEAEKMDGDAKFQTGVVLIAKQPLWPLRHNHLWPDQVLIISYFEMKDPAINRIWFHLFFPTTLEMGIDEALAKI